MTNLTHVDADGELIYRQVPSPLGELTLIATSAGLIQIAFETEPETLDNVARILNLTAEHAPGRLEEAARQLGEYFAGTRREFTIPLDLQLANGFRRLVVDELTRIGYGELVTYGELAGRVNNPDAVRAVGSACANNPIPIVVPCHRVVRSDGSWGQYRGGTEAKTFLLELEQRMA